MTIIAWDGKTLAADKLSTRQDLKQSVTKIFRLKDGSVVGISGEMSTGLMLVDWLDKPIHDENSYPDNKLPDRGCRAIMVHITNDKQIYEYSEMSKPILINDEHYTLGTGQEYAMAAMACGKNAYEACLITCSLSASCGMGIDTLTLVSAPTTE